MLKTLAECDGPDCNVNAEVNSQEKQEGCPSSWLRIQVARARFIEVATGNYIFHSGQCFVDWAINRHNARETR